MTNIDDPTPAPESPTLPITSIARPAPLATARPTIGPEPNLPKDQCNELCSTSNRERRQCLSQHRPAHRGSKTRSSQNARQHGLTAAELVIAAEDREEFDELHVQLQSDIRPQGALQRILFDQLVSAAWNLRRIRRMEAELTASAQTYLDILDNPELTAKLDRLARHHTRIERSFHRSLRELKSLQTDAALAPTLPPIFMQRAQPLASKTQIAKRTQALAVADRLNGPEEEYWSGADAEAAALRSALENHSIVSNGSTPLS